MNTKNSYIESGILIALRVFFGVQLGLTALSLWGQLFLDHDRALENSLEVLFLRLLSVSVLLLSVMIPKIPQLLRGAFLPAILVLTIIEAHTSFMGTLLINGLEQTNIEDDMAIRATQVILLLIVPLIVTAWQYSYPAVTGYIISNALIMIVMMMAIDMSFSITFISLVGFQIMMYFIVGYMVAWLMSIQRKQQSDLVEANEKVRQYALTLEQLAISRERNRLARELHDTLAHTLSGLSVQLEATDALLDKKPERARQHLRDALKVARDGMVDTRQALHALRAAPLDDLGLLLSIENLASDTSERGTFKVECKLPEQLPKLPVGTDHVIYRVIQEGLTNIARHANAKQVTVAMLPIPNAIIIEIIDDGDGFNLDAIDTNQHFGIQGMQERVAMIGGELTITTSIGSGTRLKIELEGIIL